MTFRDPTAEVEHEANPEEVMASIDKAIVEIDTVTDPRVDASVFGQPGVSVEDYFNGIIKNLAIGLSFINKSNPMRSKVEEQLETLVTKREEIFNFENVISSFIHFVTGLSGQGVSLVGDRLREERLNLIKDTLNGRIPAFNSLIEGHDMEQYRSKFEEINEKLNLLGVTNINV